jgi:hypothetical protein
MANKSNRQAKNGGNAQRETVKAKIRGAQGQMEQWKAVRKRLLAGEVIPGAEGLTAGEAANRVAEQFVLKARYKNELRSL